MARTSFGSAVGGLVWAVGMSTAAAQPVILLDQQRSTETFVIVSQCDAAFTDEEAAVGFEPFDSALGADVSCADGFGRTSAVQTSQVSPSAIAAFGAGAFTADAEFDDLIVTIGQSSLDVDFEVTAVRVFDLQALLRVAADTGAEDAGGMHAILQLTRSDGVVLLDRLVATSNGQKELAIDEVGLLEPGVYTLHAFAFAFLDDATPADRSGQAAFDLLCELRGAFCAGDASGDGLVNVADLGTLLANFGRMDADQQDGDFDHDGDVDVSDLGLLLEGFGSSCP